MRYVRFKSQTVRNAKYSYHCSGPLESYLYTQMCPVLANVLILMVLNDILRLSHQRQETWTLSKWSQEITDDRCSLSTGD